MTEQIPTEADWRSEPWSLDLKHAYRNFHGKTIAEAVQLFQQNSLLYQEDAMFMPSGAFSYYLLAYIAYIMSDAAQGDSDGARAFISLVEYKAKTKPADLRTRWSEIERVLERLANQQEWFDAIWEIDGDFRVRIRELSVLGFSVSFDVSGCEQVPKSATLEELGRLGVSRPISIDAASQVLQNSGISGISSDSTVADIVQVLGPPDRSGGGELAPTGRCITPWVMYLRSDCRIRVALDDSDPKPIMLLAPDPSL